MTKRKNPAHSQRSQRGEKNHAAKLTESDVLEIRELFLDGVSTKTLAKNFRVHLTTVNRIISGRSWAHVRKNISPFRVGGENHSNVKLKSGQVLQIKRLSREGFSSPQIAKILARQCGVQISDSNIRSILCGKRWKHLAQVSFDEPEFIKQKKGGAVEAICKNCGNPFSYHQKHSYHRAQFCSNDCRLEFQKNHYAN